MGAVTAPLLRCSWPGNRAGERAFESDSDSGTSSIRRYRIESNPARIDQELCTGRVSGVMKGLKTET